MARGPSGIGPTLGHVTPLGHAVRWRLLPALARRVGEPAHLLLPQPDPGWKQATRAYHGQQFSTMAQTYGIPFDAYVDRALHRLRAWAPSATVQVRMDSADVAKLLRDGRYRNQFTTGTSMGALAPGRRMLVEHTALGIPPSAAGTARPTYGYITGSHESHPNVVKYGDAILRLRRDVNFRTSFTFGDSLDEIAVWSPQPPFCPQPLARPTILGLDGRCDLLGAGQLWEATRCGYVEAQIHGAVTTRDVEEIVFTLSIQPGLSMREEMQRLGIAFRTVQGDEP